MPTDPNDLPSVQADLIVELQRLLDRYALYSRSEVAVLIVRDLSRTGWTIARQPAADWLPEESDE